MIRLDNLNFSYRQNAVLDEIDWHVPRGAFATILGPNGSGKSTILRLIAGTLNPRSGQVSIDGKQLADYSRKELARQLAYLPQKCEVPEFNVQEAILSGRHSHFGWFTAKRDLEIVDGLIERFGLQKLAFRPLATLSGGEFQKVTIARALAQQPRIVLLDEPTNHLDIRNQIDVADLLKELAVEMSLTVVAVFHDINLAMRVSDRFLLLKRGRIAFDGETARATEEDLGNVFDVDISLQCLNGRSIAIVTDKRKTDQTW